MALAVSDEEILLRFRTGPRTKGMFLSPEGAAATAAYDHLLATGS